MPKLQKTPLFQKDSPDHDTLTEHTVQISGIDESLIRVEKKVDKLTNLLIIAMEKKVDNSFLQWFIGIAIIISIFVSGILVTNVDQTNCNAREIAIIKAKEVQIEN